MNTIAYLTLSWILCLSLFLSPSIVLSGTKVDPHGKERMCPYCHTSKVIGNGEGGFRKDSVTSTCLECHGNKEASLRKYLQRMLPDVRNKKKLVDYFGGHPDFSCHSCHNAMSPTKSPSKELLHRFVTQNCQTTRVPGLKIQKCDTTFRIFVRSAISCLAKKKGWGLENG
jgi:hypothetical protein